MNKYFKIFQTLLNFDWTLLPYFPLFIRMVLSMYELDPENISCFSRLLNLFVQHSSTPFDAVDIFHQAKAVQFVYFVVLHKNANIAFASLRAYFVILKSLHLRRSVLTSCVSWVSNFVLNNRVLVYVFATIDVFANRSDQSCIIDILSVILWADVCVINLTVVSSSCHLVLLWLWWVGTALRGPRILSQLFISLVFINFNNQVVLLAKFIKSGWNNRNFVMCIY